MSFPITTLNSNNRSVKIIDFGLDKRMIVTTMLSEFVFMKNNFTGRYE